MPSKIKRSISFINKEIFYNFYFQRKEFNLNDYLLLKKKKIKHIGHIKRLICDNRKIIIYIPPNRHFI